MAKITTTGANMQNFKFLRKGEVLGSYEAATSALKAADVLESALDGSFILARYSGLTGASDSTVHTVIGAYYKTSDDATTASVSFVDGDGIAKTIGELSTFVGFDPANPSTGTPVAKQISDAINALDVETVSGVGQVIVSVGQTDGKVSATLGEVNAKYVKVDVEVDGEDETKSLEDLLGEIEEFVGFDPSDPDSSTPVEDQIEDAINDLTFAGVATDKVVTNVTQTSGVVSASATDLGSIKVGAFTSNTATVGAVAADDTLAVALNKLENQVKAAKSATTLAAGDDSVEVVTGATGTTVAVNLATEQTHANIIETVEGDGLYANVHVVKATTGLPANVKERYTIVNGTGTTALGENIDIYKDSALLDVKLLHASGDSKPTYDKSTGWTDITSPAPSEANLALCFAYENENGAVVVVAVPVGDFLRESEFKDGLAVSNGVVTVSADTASEKVTTGDGATVDVITVSAAGVKIANIQKAIDYKVSTLDKSDSQEDGKVVVKVEEADGIVTPGKAELVTIKLTNYTAGTTTGAITANDTVGAAFGKIENEIAGVKATATKNQVTAGNGIDIDTTTGANTIVKAKAAANSATGITNPITVDGDGIKFATVLDAGTF